MDTGGHFAADLGGVGGAGAENDLERRVEVGNGVEEVKYAFLARDAADEEDVGAGAVDAVAVEDVGVHRGAVFVEIDAVMDDVDAVSGDVEEAQDVVARLAGDGDDGAGLLDGGAFHPGAEVVGLAELFDFPRDVAARASGS